MAFLDFVALYATENKRSVEELLAERPLSFPMATNDRGEASVRSLQTWSRVSLSGKRALDVGCSYGGLAIALAKAGASAVGIDSNPKLLAYAEANVFGDSSINLSLCDLSSIAIRQKFAPRSFDLIFLNDALERNYDIDTLISNVDYLLAEDGLIYFRTVNSNSTRFILADGHKKLFGLPLIDPDLWYLLKQKRASIYYRSLSNYVAMFQFHNMPKRVFVDEEQVLSRRNERRLSAQIKEIFSKARSEQYTDATLTAVLRKQTIRLRDRYMFDLQNFGPDLIKFKYGTMFFSGCLGRPDSDLGLRSSAIDLPEFGTIVPFPQRDLDAQQEVSPATPAREGLRQESVV